MFTLCEKCLSLTQKNFGTRDAKINEKSLYKMRSSICTSFECTLKPDSHSTLTRYYPLFSSRQWRDKTPILFRNLKIKTVGKGPARSSYKIHFQQPNNSNFLSIDISGLGIQCKVIRVLCEGHIDRGIIKGRSPLIELISAQRLSQKFSKI